MSWPRKFQVKSTLPSQPYFWNYPPLSKARSRQVIPPVSNPSLHTYATRCFNKFLEQSKILFFWEGKWYIFIQEVQRSLLSGKRRPFFTSFIRGKNPLCRSSQKADFPHPFSAFFPLLTWALFSFIFCNTWTSSRSRSCSSIIMDYQSSFLTAKELVANSEKRALSTKKGSPGTFSNFQGRAEAEPLMRLLLCLFPLNSQLPCQEWHFSIASSKKVHLESSRSPAESSYIHYSILMAPTITYSRMHISISKGQFSCFLHFILKFHSNWHFNSKQVI